MSSARLVLASASPARLTLLRAAGIEPDVVVSDVDEDALTTEVGTDDPDVVVAALARAKAEAVAARLANPVAARVANPVAARPATGPASGESERGDGRTLVLGCDSLFTIHGRTWGKPSGPEEAIERITSMGGSEGVLATGHHLVDLRDGRAVGGVARTTVRFAPMTGAEVAAYVATGEPLRVAGSFTLDGRSAPWVEGVVGDHTNVVGLSLPLLRDLLGRLGVSVVDLWDRSEESP